MRQPDGHVKDYVAAMLPLGFAPEDLAVPVEVWAGADHRLLLTSWPAEFARRISRATLDTRSGGHVMAPRALA